MEIVMQIVGNPWKEHGITLQRTIHPMTCRKTTKFQPPSYANRLLHQLYAPIMILETTKEVMDLLLLLAPVKTPSARMMTNWEC
jgi:hypothetical protein